MVRFGPTPGERHGRPFRHPGGPGLAQHQPLPRRDPPRRLQPDPDRPRGRRRAPGHSGERGPGGGSAAQGPGRCRGGRPAQHGRPGRRGCHGRSAPGGPGDRGPGDPGQEERQRRRLRRRLPPGRLRRRPRQAPRRDPGHRALEHERQRGQRPGRPARWHPLRRRLPHHPGHRDAGVARPPPGEGRRRPAPGRGRTGLGQHDHWRLLRRRPLPHRHLRSRPQPHDGGPGPGGRQRDAHRRRQCHARRPLHRHPHQVRTVGPQYRPLRFPRRRPAPGAGGHRHPRLRLHHPVGGAPGGTSANRRHRPHRSGPGPVPHHLRPPGQLPGGPPAPGGGDGR